MSMAVTEHAAKGTDDNKNMVLRHEYATHCPALHTRARGEITPTRAELITGYEN